MSSLISAEWTRASMQPHFFWLPIPAHALLPLLLCIMHLRTWTVTLLVITLVFLFYLNMRKRKVPWLFRRIRAFMRGYLLYSRPVWYRRRTHFLNSIDLIKIR